MRWQQFAIHTDERSKPRRKTSFKRIFPTKHLGTVRIITAAKALVSASRENWAWRVCGCPLLLLRSLPRAPQSSEYLKRQVPGWRGAQHVLHITSTVAPLLKRRTQLPDPTSALHLSCFRLGQRTQQNHLILQPQPHGKHRRRRDWSCAPTPLLPASSFLPEARGPAHFRNAGPQPMACVPRNVTSDLRANQKQ